MMLTRPTKRLAPLFLVLIVAFAASCNSSTTEPEEEPIDTAWTDEFDGTSVDTSKWEFQIGTGCDQGICGWGNNELQYYRRENARVENGGLIITAKRENYQGQAYTSARLRTRNKADFRYGRFEARMKLPRGQGIWPAFWMLPTDEVYGGWAASGEIDIMEAINQVEAVHGTLHYGGGWPDNTSSTASYTDATGDFSADYHVYALEWEPDEMRWYVDGTLYATQDAWHTSEAAFPAPFDQRFHLLVNLAVGGNWPGPPDETTAFPQEFRIDWIRVSPLEP